MEEVCGRQLHRNITLSLIGLTCPEGLSHWLEFAPSTAIQHSLTTRL